jgi:hypothetical protein
MNYYERPTALQERAYAGATLHFAEHLKQLNAGCDAVHHLERNLTMTAIRGVMICRRSSRQCIARLIRLRSLHPPPGSGDFASMILRWGTLSW